MKIVDKDNFAKSFAEGSPEAHLNDNNKWRTTLEITNRAGLGNAPQFENGVVHIYPKNDSESPYMIPSEVLLITAYGTDFDMDKHSYQFHNGGWNDIDKSWTDDYFKAVETVGGYVNILNKIELWNEVGMYFPWERIQDIFKNKNREGPLLGLCYGMANTVIANYAHGILEKTNAWGLEKDLEDKDDSGFDEWVSFKNNSWQTAIDTRWGDTENAPNGHHRPYDFDEIYSDITSSNNWTFEACKKNCLLSSLPTRLQR